MKNESIFTGEIPILYDFDTDNVSIQQLENVFTPKSLFFSSNFYFKSANMCVD
jgi:hypothetical protein